MLSATIECRSQVPSAIARASRASPEDFREFLQDSLRSEDTQNVVWADLLPDEDSGTRRGWFSSLLAPGRRAKAAERENKPWRMAMKLPLLLALEVLGIQAQFRTVLPKTRRLSPAVFCALAGK